MKLFAVVLTFNRRDLLRECLHAIAQQTLGCAAIIVVDNASTDGTVEMLRQDFPDVEVARLARNAGAAGGFEVGMRLAVRAGADRVWVMDDDVIADASALAELNQALDFTRMQGRSPPYVISAARAPDGCLTNVPEIAKSLNELHYQNWPIFLDHALAPVTRATFVSILIPRRTFERFGYPLAAMYIWGEDREYTVRITKEEPGFISGLSRVLHVRAQAGLLSIDTETNPTRLQWHQLLVRNRLFTIRRHGSPRELIRRVRADASNAVRLLLNGNRRKAVLVAKGLFAGLRFAPSDRPDPAACRLESVTPWLKAQLAAACEHRAETGCSDDPIRCLIEAA